MNRAEAYLDRLAALDLEIRQVEAAVRAISSEPSAHPKFVLMLVKRQDALWAEWSHCWTTPRPERRSAK